MHIGEFNYINHFTLQEVLATGADFLEVNYQGRFQMIESVIVIEIVKMLTVFLFGWGISKAVSDKKLNHILDKISDLAKNISELKAELKAMKIIDKELRELEKRVSDNEAMIKVLDRHIDVVEQEIV